MRLNKKLCINGLRRADFKLLTLCYPIWITQSAGVLGLCQCDRSDTLEGRLTGCRIIEILLYGFSKNNQGYTMKLLIQSPRNFFACNMESCYKTISKTRNLSFIFKS